MEVAGEGLPLSGTRAAQFARYGVVGAIATATHYLLLVLAVEKLGWPAWAASGAGAVLGAQVAYFGNLKLTFRRHAATPASWVMFQLVALAGALVGMAIVAIAVRLGLHYLLAQCLATAVVLVLGYSANRVWTFG